MQKKIGLESLCSSIYDLLKAVGLGKYSLRNHYYEGMWPIIKAYRAAGKEVYDTAFTAEIVSQIEEQYSQGIVGRHINMHTRKMSVMMKEYYDTGNLNWHRIQSRITVPLSPYYETIWSDFKADEERQNLRESGTIQTLTGIIRRFFKFLEESGHETLENVTLKTVSDYFPVVAPTHQGQMDSISRALRYLCKFIQESCIDCIDFSPALTIHPSKRRKLMPVFTANEVTAITISARNHVCMAKRDTAIFELAQSVGLRCGDVSKLELSNIMWNSNEIRFVQHKTNVELVLPLEPQVGNAIADYILNERPKTESPYLFIRSRAPFDQMSSCGIGDRLRFHMKNSGISYVPGDKKGFHSFRRYVVSEMLNEGVAADTVKGIVGHLQIDSLKPYIRISQKKLRSCALDLTGIEVTREDLR